MARQSMADALEEVLDSWEKLDLPSGQQARALTSQRAKQVLDRVGYVTGRRSETLDAAVAGPLSAAATAAVLELEDRLLWSRDSALRHAALARQSGDNDQAEDAAKAAAALSDGLFEDEGFGGALNLLGQMARARGDTLTGLRWYGAAKDLAERRNLPHTLCAAMDNTGMCLASMGRLDEAIAAFEHAASAATTADETLAVANNQAMTLAGAGRVRQASALLQSVAGQAMAGASLPPLQHAVMLDNLASVAFTVGDVDQAATLLGRARPIFDGLPNRLDRARHALNWMSVAEWRHDRPGEVAAFTEAHDLLLSHWRANADAARYVAAFRATIQAATSASANLEAGLQPGLDLLNAGEAARALSHFAAVYQQAEAAGDRYVVARAAVHAGMALREMGHLDEAHAGLRQAAALAREAGDARLEVQALWNLKLLADDSGEVGGDLTGPPMLLHLLALEELLPTIADAIGMQGLARESYLGGMGSTQDQLGRMAASHGANDLARHYFAEALALAPANPGNPAQAFARTNRLAEKVVALPDDATAADLAELEHLATTWQSDRRVVMSARRALGLQHKRHERWPEAAEQLAASCARGEELRATLTAAERAEAGSAPGPWLALMECRAHLGDTDGALQASQAAKGRHVVDCLDARAGTQGNGAPLDIQEIRLRLDQTSGSSGACLVDLLAGGSNLMLVVVNADRAEMRMLPLPEHGGGLTEIEKTAALDGAPGLLRLVREDPVLQRLATEVAQLVPAGVPVLACLDPDLQQLPLAALSVDGQPWCDRNAWSLLPAVGMLRHISGQPVARHGRCFVAGDSRGDLPGARRECEMVAAAVNALPAAIGEQCTVAALHDSLTQGPLDLVHLAVHGLGDRARGRYSGLIMADPQQDSVLVPFEQLTAIGLSADLVVLSGCSTAVAGPLHRTRMAGVSVAAIESGARSVIGCLWPVDDVAAEMFMKAFYGALVQAWNSGPVDLRTCMDAGRAAVRTWLTSTAAPGGHPRDGTRDMPPEIAAMPGGAPLDPADAMALDWAPFMLIGDPVLFG